MNKKIAILKQKIKCPSCGKSNRESWVVECKDQDFGYNIVLCNYCNNIIQLKQMHPKMKEIKGYDQN